MSRNGSGVYTLPANNPVVTGTSISSTWANNTLGDVASALTQSLSKDGQTTPTNNLTMGGFKLTNLAAGTLVGDSLRYEQLFSQGVPIDVASAATVDIGALNTTFANVTGNTTITSLGTNYNGPRLLKFVASLTLTYNATTLITPSLANFVVSAGSYAIAVPKSTTSGTADGWKIISYQQADGSTLPFVDTNPVVVGSVDSTKKARFEVDTLLTTGNTRALTVQDRDYTLAGLDDLQSVTNSIIPLPTPTLSANAMTIPAATYSMDVRSATLGSGTITHINGTAAALVIPAGATLGTISGQPSTIIVVELNNAGAWETAVINLAGGNDLTETGLISTTAISAGSTSGSVFYSNTARTNVAYRVVGRIDSTQATAGQWATAPSLVQGVGGQALTAMSSLGYGQTWQDVSASRSSGTTYYNTTGKPIMAVMRLNFGGATGSGQITVNGAIITDLNNTAAAGSTMSASCIVPPNVGYSFTWTPAVKALFELR